MSKNAVLTDENDEQLMPITTSENVFVSADKTLKQYLDELASGGSAYILPVASSTKLGGIKVGLGFTINDDGLLSIDGNSEVFQSVSNGKAKIAAAITDKGQPTAADATFQTMADNIALINNESIVNNAIYMTDNFFEFGSIIPFAENVDLSLLTIPIATITPIIAIETDITASMLRLILKTSFKISSKTTTPAKTVIKNL